jgi:chemotaxis protein methyltransferase CheR
MTFHTSPASPPFSPPVAISGRTVGISENALARSAVLSGALEQVSDAQLARYADLIYTRTGVRVSPQKKALLSNRLRRRLRSTGIDGFEEYYRHLKRLPPHDSEWDHFLQEITTHETYLFRDQVQWDWFQTVFLPEFAAARRSGGLKYLRIWSAACSTGDEAFTAACCIAACLPEVAGWKVQILGTDIGKGAVDQAKTGTFGERAMRLVPDSWKRSYFSKAKDADLWQAKPILTDMVAFRQHNLMEPLRERPFDLVFLKNVLIYFDRESKKRVIENVQTTLRAGGVLVAGTAEGAAEMLREFERVESWLLRKPLR